MKNTNQDFREDIKNLLAGFIDGVSLKDFKQNLNGGIKTSNNSLDAINKFYAQQLKIEYGFAKDRMEIDRAITYAKKTLSKEKYLELNKMLGQICIGHGKLNLAYEILNRVVRESETAGEKAEGLLVLSDVFSRRAEWKKSIMALEQAKELFLSERNDLGTSKCENMLGSIYGERGELNKAKMHFENSLQLLNPEKEKELAALVESNLGVIENIQGNYPKAIEYFKNSQRKFESFGNYRRIAEIKQNIGMIYFNKKKYNKAIEEFNQSIDIAQANGFLPVLGLSYHSKANVLIEMGDYNAASQFADKAMEVSHQIDDKLTIADVYRTKSIIERKLKNFNLAKNYLKSSLRLNIKLSNSLNIAETSFELANLYGELNRPAEKQEFLKEALKHYCEVRATEQIQNIEKLLNEIVT